MLFRVNWYDFQFKKFFVKLVRKKHMLTCLLTDTMHAQQRQLLLGTCSFQDNLIESAIGSKTNTWSAQGLNQKITIKPK